MERWQLVCHVNDGHHMAQVLEKYTYRLKLSDDDTGIARDVEFEAPDASAALALAQQVCGNRAVDLFLSGHKLGRIKQARQGFWIVD